MSRPEKEHLIQPSGSKQDTSTIQFTSGNSKQELNIIKELGHGAFGQVVLATDNRGKEFAVKMVKCHNLETYQTIAQELNILLSLSHDNIMKLFAIDFNDFTALFVMEYCSNGTLNKRLDNSVEMITKFKWMQQLASALSYLHKNHVVHRDLKPENVLLDQDDEIKLADFGIARNFMCMTTGRQEYSTNPDAYLSEYLDTDMGTFAGTPYWVAPEVFDHSYDEKADIFSLGVIFYAILTHQVILFEDQKYYGAFVEHYGKRVGLGLAMAEQGKQLYPEFNSEHNVHLVLIIKSMLDYKAENRKPLDTIFMELNDAFMQHLNDSKSTLDKVKENIRASGEFLANEIEYLGCWNCFLNCWQQCLDHCKYLKDQFADCCHPENAAGDQDEKVIISQ